MTAKGKKAPGGIATRIERFDPKDLLLLERNARFMRHEQFSRLVENVKRDGRLTSVPFACLEPDGKYRVLSGNHRVQAAVEAGLQEIDVMVTDDPLTDAQRVAIQISHNAIAGEDDPAVLKALYESVEDLDWRMYSGLDDKTLDLLDQVQVGSISEANLDYQTLTIVFLPDELERARTVLEEAMTLSKGANERWLAKFDDHTRMLEALSVVGQSHNISNVATGFMLILDLFDRHVSDVTEGWWDDNAQDTRHNGWVPLSPVTGATAPTGTASVVKQAIERVTGQGDATHPWQALELICADYLAGAP
jgi:hypothetical protein